MEFREFDKIPRLKRNVVITEKIDGTNACVVISPEGIISAQSRSQIITPDNDNYGFARWVEDNSEELAKLGGGYHFGEWWGSGIQRRYGMDRKVFSLFNVGRWTRAPGEGYEKCQSICQQAGHAEAEAVKAAGEAARGATAYLWGHYWMCEPCGRALREAGVISVTVYPAE